MYITYDIYIYIHVHMYIYIYIHILSCQKNKNTFFYNFFGALSEKKSGNKRERAMCIYIYICIYICIYIYV